jgi:hypothetical protein
MRWLLREAAVENTSHVQAATLQNNTMLYSLAR